MVLTPGQELIQRFEMLVDPRIERCKKHKLVDILMIAFCATLSGAEGWEEMEEFGAAKETWLRQFLELRYGIPSHDTISRVLRRLKPEALEEVLVAWLLSLKGEQGQQINLDGKTLRHSFDRACQQSPLHLLNAWAAETSIFLGQRAVADKENEIVAIPDLLRLLALEATVVSIDAIGCQTAIAQQIIDQQGDYLLALKENQPSLYQEVVAFFAEVQHPEMSTLVASTQTVDADHGRVETRSLWVCDSLDWLEQRGRWKGLQTVIRVDAQRESATTHSQQTRYYISSLPKNPQRLQQAIRNHWRIENTLHWCLDMTFAEDASRVRKDHAPQNLSLLRKIALSWLKQESSKGSIKAKRKRAGWNNFFLEKVLFTE